MDKLVQDNIVQQKREQQLKWYRRHLIFFKYVFPQTSISIRHMLFPFSDMYFPPKSVSFIPIANHQKNAPNTFP